MPEPRESDALAGHRIHADRAIGALAAEQYGVVSRRQLLAAGLTHAIVRRRVTNGRLIQIHRGVYAVGHDRLTLDGHWLAAVLAAGPGAVLSHREAAALHELRPSNRTTVDVTVAAQRRVAGVRVHRVRALSEDDVTVVDGIPVTSVARTLVDLAAVVPTLALRKALEEAERSHRLDVRGIEWILQRTRGRNGPGHAAIRRALADLARTGTTVTRSVLEDRFLALLDAHSLPRPSANAWTEAMEVDAAWPAARLVVELDGWEGHSTRHAFQRDRTRSNDLQTEGWTILRFTHADVVHRADETAARVGRVLRRQAATATG
jgi:predicted transcriptional regulator of viral defense system